MKSTKRHTKRLILLFFVLLAFLTLQFGCERSSQKENIEIVINEKELATDADPIVVNDRVMVPMRAVLEELNAEVDWNQQSQTAFVKKEDTQMEITVGENYALVNGKRRWLDSPAFVQSDRTFIPIRVVSEAFGMRVDWDEEKNIIIISEDAEKIDKSGKVSIENMSFYIGQSEAEVLDRFGNPAKKIRSEKGFTWYIYSSDYSNYFQLGVDRGQIVAIYTNSKNFNYDNKILFGMPKSEVEAQIPDKKSFFDNKYEARLEKEVLTIFIDIHENNAVTSVLLMENEVYGRIPLDFSGEIKTGNELQLLELSNSVRIRYGLEPLTWDESISDVARNHSEDMSENDFFSHTNLNGETPFDRMKRNGIKYWSAAENIAAGYPNSIYAHEAWMNSKDHREAILLNIEKLGTGIAQNSQGYIYYTENFYTPR